MPGGPVKGGAIAKVVLTIQEVTYVNPPTNTIYGNPTSWYWNIRQGDRMRFNDAGDYYTIVGPMLYGPPQSGSTTITNPERYINLGKPANTFPGTPQFLYVLNGEDDNGNGIIDEAFDGIDNDGDGIIDPSFNGLDDDADGVIDNEYDAYEFEDEQFDASQYTPFALPSNVAYTIYRRPVVSQTARETALPSGVVVDATSWEAPSIPGTPFTLRPERSRLPIDPYTYYVDIMVAANGQVVQGGAGGSSPDYNGLAPAANQPFYQFWITEREGVVSPLWGQQSITNRSNSTLTLPVANPNYNASSNPVTNLLPMPSGSPRYTGIALTGERRMVTLFVKTGQITSSSIEIVRRLRHQRPLLRCPSRDQGAAMISRGIRPRSGITLTEILIAILIMGVGLISLATLFPLGLIRLREAARYQRGRAPVRDDRRRHRRPPALRQAVVHPDLVVVHPQRRRLAAAPRPVQPGRPGDE